MRQFQRHFGSAVILILSLAAVAAPAQTPAQTIDTIDPALRTRIDHIATQVLEQTGVPSASVAVVKAGKLAYRELDLDDENFGL